jgi:ABC-2 type transport system ATP-binding protein
MRLDAGAISLLGHPPGAPSALQRLGYLPEQPAYPGVLTGREFLVFVAQLLGITGDRAVRRADELLDQVGIAHAGRKRISGYSKGMTQRLGLAQALIGDPELLVLDEPMSGLDPIGRAQVKDLLREHHRRGASIVFCSHILDDVERLCDDVIMLSQGEVRFRGTVAELLARGAPRSSVLVHSVDRPRVASEHWVAVGHQLWSAGGIAPADVDAIHRAAANHELEVIRFQRMGEDLETLFARLAAGGDA